LLQTAVFSLPHFDSYVGAHFRAQGATGAFFIPADEYDGKLSALIELLADLQEILRTGGGAQLAPLAEFLIDNDLAHVFLLQK
jgi:hypothetical protein